MLFLVLISTFFFTANVGGISDFTFQIESELVSFQEPFFHLVLH